MARVAGVNIPDNKQVWVSLSGHVFGIGRTRAIKICEDTGIDRTINVADLSEEQLADIRDAVAKYDTEGDLRRTIAMNKKRLRDIKCYRGDRHRRGLPLRGQRTRTNARTAKRRGAK
tara:strand:- start:21260 stop:21610 length:351 start_codon:yes stop_codon:yes gene_type:complete